MTARDELKRQSQLNSAAYALHKQFRGFKMDEAIYPIMADYIEEQKAEAVFRALEELAHRVASDPSADGSQVIVLAWERAHRNWNAAIAKFQEHMEPKL
jgi:hypothetical protein